MGVGPIDDHRPKDSHATYLSTDRRRMVCEFEAGPRVLPFRRPEIRSRLDGRTVHTRKAVVLGGLTPAAYARQLTTGPKVAKVTAGF